MNWNFLLTSRKICLRLFLCILTPKRSVRSQLQRSVRIKTGKKTGTNDCRGGRGGANAGWKVKMFGIDATGVTRAKRDKLIWYIYRNIIVIEWCLHSTLKLTFLFYNRSCYVNNHIHYFHKNICLLFIFI